MKPQYVARQSSSNQPFEASESHHLQLAACGYLFGTRSHKLTPRFTQWTYTSRGTGLQGSPVDLNRNCDRRLLCPKASNCLPYSALRSQRPHAQKKHRLKSSSWLIPRQSPLSRHTQVSTSNLPSRQAFAPALTQASLHQIGGASWH